MSSLYSNSRFLWLSQNFKFHPRNSSSTRCCHRLAPVTWGPLSSNICVKFNKCPLSPDPVFSFAIWIKFVPALPENLYLVNLLLPLSLYCHYFYQHWCLQSKLQMSCICWQVVSELEINVWMVTFSARIYCIHLNCYGSKFSLLGRHDRLMEPALVAKNNQYFMWRLNPAHAKIHSIEVFILYNPGIHHTWPNTFFSQVNGSQINHKKSKLVQQFQALNWTKMEFLSPMGMIPWKTSESQIWQMQRTLWWEGEEEISGQLQF